MWRILHLGPVHLLNNFAPHTWRSWTKILKTSIRKALANIDGKFQCSALRFPQLANGNGVKTWWIWISENEILWRYTTPPSFSVGRNHLTSFDDAYTIIYCFLGEMSCFFCVEYMVHMCVDQAKIRWRGLPLHSGWWSYLGILRCPMVDTDHRSLPASVWLLFVVVCEQKKLCPSSKVTNMNVFLQTHQLLHDLRKTYSWKQRDLHSRLKFLTSFLSEFNNTAACAWILCSELLYCTNLQNI